MATLGYPMKLSNNLGKPHFLIIPKRVGGKFSFELKTYIFNLNSHHPRNSQETFSNTKKKFVPPIFNKMLEIFHIKREINFVLISCKQNTESSTS